MNFERLSNEHHPMYEAALALYRISFPQHEQRNVLSQEKILNDKAYHFNLIYDESTFVGIMLLWETDSFYYVEHFCILPDKRGKRYGQRALELLGERKKTVILEIDPPVDEVSVRRKGFYERYGFVENPYSHIHPPYHEENTGHNLVIMSAPNKLTQNEYYTFKQYLEYHVMKDVFL